MTPRLLRPPFDPWISQLSSSVTYTRGTKHWKSPSADGGSSTKANQGSFSRDGLLYHRHRKPGSNASTEVQQLVLPTQCRKSVIEVAHDIPMAGHLGRRKTIGRILQRFYWPGIYRDVSDHCSCCEQCQKSSSRRTKRAPLIPLL